MRVVQREFYILMRNITRRNVSLRSMCCFSPKTYIRYQAILRINAKHIMSCHGKIPLPVPCTHIIAIDSLHTIFPIAYILCLISHIPYDRIFISTLSPIHIQIHQFPCAFPSSPSVSGFISAKSIRMWNGYILSIISCVNHSNTVIILITHQQFFRKRIIVELMTENPAITRIEIAEKMGMHESSVQRRLESLVRDGCIRHIGPTNGGVWEITEKK